jgi:hypothetical protein
LPTTTSASGDNFIYNRGFVKPKKIPKKIPKNFLRRIYLKDSLALLFCAGITVVK